MASGRLVSYDTLGFSNFPAANRGVALVWWSLVLRYTRIIRPTYVSKRCQDLIASTTLTAQEAAKLHFRDT